MKKTENTIFCLPKEIFKQLNEYHERTMVPKSKLVAKLLKEFFEKEKNEKI